MSATYRYLKSYFGMSTSEEGATAIEYGILAALIAVVIITAVILVGQTLDGVFRDVDGALQGVDPN